MLNTVSHGPENGRPLLIAHGLFGSARNWGAVAKRLSDARPVLAVDMRNHGASDWADSHSYADLAEDLAEVIAAHGGQADVLGHSMGGKAAMVLALARPDSVRRLIVADIAPVAYSHTQAHLIEAMRGLDMSAIARRSEADTALKAEIAEPGVRAFLLQSLDVEARRWRLNLDVLEPEMPKIIGWPDPPGQFDGATLFLSGALSDYLLPAHHAAILEQFPAATFEAIDGAGHWVHAEKPLEFEAAVTAFLDA